MLETGLLLVYLSPQFGNAARTRAALSPQLQELEATPLLPATLDSAGIPNFQSLGRLDSTIRAIEAELLATARPGEDNLSVFIPPHPLDWAAVVSAVVTFLACVATNV